MRRGSNLLGHTSATGVDSPLPQLHRDWADPHDICTGAGLTPATCAPGLGSAVPLKGIAPCLGRNVHESESSAVGCNLVHHVASCCAVLHIRRFPLCHAGVDRICPSGNGRQSVPFCASAGRASRLSAKGCSASPTLTRMFGVPRTPSLQRESLAAGPGSVTAFCVVHLRV